MRTPELLEEAVRRDQRITQRLRARRPLLAAALSGDRQLLERELAAETERERVADREYWAPLRRELAQLRREQPRVG